MLEVVRSSRASGRDTELLVLSSLNGVPTDAVVTSVTAFSESRRDGFGSTPLAFTTTPVLTGVQAVSVILPGRNSSTKTVLITVERILDEANSQFGSTLASVQGSGDDDDDD